MFLANYSKMRIIVCIILICFFSGSFAQLLNYPDIPNDTRVVFIGEAHRIEENYSLQLDIIKHYVENGTCNAVILEKSTSFQVIIDNMVNNRDTTGLHLVLPVLLCNDTSCRHNIEPMRNFLIQLTDLAREKNIKVYCIDVDNFYQKTKKILTALVDTSYTLNMSKGDVFRSLKVSNTDMEIKDELLSLYVNRGQWKNSISKSAYEYIDNILTNVFIQNEKDYVFQRDLHFYHQFNTLLKKNKKMRVIAINGQAHTHKYYDPQLKTSHIPRKSVASYLNNEKKSVCKDKVTSIALNYFFNSDADSTFTYFTYFENEDLQKLKSALGNEKYFISKTSDIPLSPFLCETYDYVIAINDCHKLSQHAMLYYREKPTFNR